MKKLKLISMLCTLVLLFGCIAVFPAFAESKVWTEADGTGTAGVTYELNQDNFHLFWKTARAGGDIKGNYVLTTNVIFNEGKDASDWIDASKRPAAGSEGLWDCPIGNLASFRGTFDGQGHTISGICMIPYQAALRSGLFNWVQSDATVKNLRLENCYFENQAKIADGYFESGSIACRLANGIIENIYSDVILNNTNTDSSEGNVVLGGIVGFVHGGATDAQIRNCVFAGKIVNSISVTGGIVGKINGGNTATISNCVNMGSIKSSGDICGAILGRNSGTCKGIINCMNLSADVREGTRIGSSLYGAGYTTAVPVTNFKLVTGYKTNEVSSGKGVSDAPAWDIKEITLNELLDDENKVFPTWTYKDGTVPTPTSGLGDISLAKIASGLNNTMLGLATEGEIHSIRISHDNPGLRFETHVDGDMLAKLKAAGAKLTMTTYITAGNYITGVEGAVFTKEALDETGKQYLTVVAEELLRTDDVDGYTAFAGSVVNINEKSMKYIAVGALTIELDGSTYTIYAKWSANESVSVSDIATLAAGDVKSAAEDGYENAITDIKGASVYSPYNQTEYDCIKSLISDPEA